MTVRSPLASAFLALVLTGLPAGAGYFAAASEDISHGGARVFHQGGGVFQVTPASAESAQPAEIDVKRIRHRYDPAVDPDFQLSRT